MTKLLLVLLLALPLFKTTTASASTLKKYDAYTLCPNFRDYLYGYNANSGDVDACITKLEQNSFQEDALLICLTLSHHTTGYNIAGHQVLDCLSAIANKTYSENRIRYCKQIKNINTHYMTPPSAITDCLK